MIDKTTLPSLVNPDVESLIRAWVAAWNSYDLNEVMCLFADDDRLTYFSSEKPGLICGYQAVAEHHRGFGFVENGKPSMNKLWLDKIGYSQVGDATIITALWYFQKPSGPRQWGPVTFVSICERVSSRFLHVQFASYATSAQ